MRTGAHSLTQAMPLIGHVRNYSLQFPHLVTPMPKLSTHLAWATRFNPFVMMSAGFSFEGT